MLNNAIILFNSMVTVFDNERARKYRTELHRLIKELDDAKNSFFPFFSRDKIKLAEQALDRFLISFAQEFDKEMLKNVR